MKNRLAHKRIYLDYAATTPVDPKVLAAMRPYFDAAFGNASSLHFYGQEARAAVDRSRETIVGLLGAKFDEIVFTSGATEANNLVFSSVVGDAKKMIARPRVIIGATEHDSVRGVAEFLSRLGVEVVTLPVDKEGRVRVGDLEKALTPETVLVSLMYANNEIGTIAPIGKLAEVAQKFRGKARYPLLHTDAVQAFQFLDCNVDTLGVDFMTLSAHKVYGPKGVGALYVRGGRVAHKKMMPMFLGGDQEFGVRSGTENVAGIVGCAKAMEIATALRAKEGRRVAALRNDFLRGLKKVFPKVVVNGVAGTARNAFVTLPNILNVYVPDFLAQDFMMACDLQGVAISTGSACSMGSTEPSRVIEALGYSEARALRSVRFSFGKQTTAEEIRTALGAIRAFQKKR